MGAGNTGGTTGTGAGGPVPLFGTVEYINDQIGVAVVTLTDAGGEWAGSGRVEIRSSSRAALYEAAYIRAAQAAASKGGCLKTFAAVGVVTFAVFASACAERVALTVERRPGNALNVEVGCPADRCRMQPPGHWPAGGPGVARWLASGGSPLVLGACSDVTCPLQGGDVPRLAERVRELEAENAGLRREAAEYRTSCCSAAVRCGRCARDLSVTEKAVQS